MKRTILPLLIVALFLAVVSPASAYLYQDNFETSWSGDYAAGWDNEGYRHGDAPVAIMQQTDISYGGSYGVKIIADSVPGNLGFDPWWAIVFNTNVNISAMTKQYDPYIKVMYYDNLATSVGGQLYTVPTGVVPDDWTDVQFGSRFNQTDNYYYVTAPTGGWQDTGVVRSDGWHELKMQLSSLDGYIHFYIDGIEVGVSTRNDYTDLGTGMLSVMFNPPLSDWGTDKPFIIYDNFEVGSTSPVPLPGAVWLLGSGLVGLGLWGRRKFF
jgi:hypothetical protein